MIEYCLCSCSCIVIAMLLVKVRQLQRQNNAPQKDALAIDIEMTPNTNPVYRPVKHGSIGNSTPSASINTLTSVSEHDSPKTIALKPAIEAKSSSQGQKKGRLGNKQKKNWAYTTWRRSEPFPKLSARSERSKLIT